MRRFFSLLAVCVFAVTAFIARPLPADAGLGCPPGCALVGILSGTGLLPVDFSTFSFTGSAVLVGSGPSASLVTGGLFTAAIQASISVGANEAVTGSGWVYMNDGSFYETYFGNVTIGGTLAAMTIASADVNKFTGTLIRVGLPGATSAPYAGLITLTR